MASDEALEVQCKQHGYSIRTKVDRTGMAIVTLTTTYGPTQEFMADSGQDTSRTRYHTALAIAVDRMLDYEYRSKSGRPALGQSII